MWMRGSQNDKKIEPTAATDTEKAALLRALTNESSGHLATRLQSENAAFRVAHGLIRPTDRRGTEAKNHTPLIASKKLS